MEQTNSARGTLSLRLHKAHCKTSAFRLLSAGGVLQLLDIVKEHKLDGQMRWLVAQKNQVRNGEIYRYIAGQPVCSACFAQGVCAVEVSVRTPLSASVPCEATLASCACWWKICNSEILLCRVGCTLGLYALPDSTRRLLSLSVQVPMNVLLVWLPCDAELIVCAGWWRHQAQNNGQAHLARDLTALA